MSVSNWLKGLVEYCYTLEGDSSVILGRWAVFIGLKNIHYKPNLPKLNTVVYKSLYCVLKLMQLIIGKNELIEEKLTKATAVLDSSKEILNTLEYEKKNIEGGIP